MKLVPVPTCNIVRRYNNDLRNNNLRLNKYIAINITNTSTRKYNNVYVYCFFLF